MRKLIYTLIIISISFSVIFSQPTPTQFPTIKTRFTIVENVILSKWSLAPITGLWAYTSNYLKKNWQGLEGNPAEPWTDHHLHSGFLVHCLGVYLKNYQSDFYSKHFGIRVWTNLGSLIMLDDAYQHLILQPNDQFHKHGDPIYKMSPIGAYYKWALKPERSNEFWQFTFFMCHFGSN